MPSGLGEFPQKIGRCRIRSGGAKARSASFSLFERLYGEDFWEYRVSRFLPTVRDALDGMEGVLVDAACGSWNVFLARLTRGETIGIDLDGRVRDWNKLHERILIQDVHDAIPLENVGAVISVYTWEHLRAPDIVLGRFHNILKPGAPLIIAAPQKYGYASILTMLLGAGLRDWLWRVMRGRKRMPFPVYYRLCTRASLAPAADAAGFDLVEYESHDIVSDWFLTMPPVFLLGCAWMWLLNRFDVLAPLRSNFVAVLRKR